jgi:hypothetical protein
MKLFLLLMSMLITMASFSQEKKWYKITKNDLAVMSLQVVSGVADGFNQAIVHHKYGKGHQFWDFKLSHVNKYKNFPTDTSPAYFGSKSFTVRFSDGFHWTRGIMFDANNLSIAISSSDFEDYAKKDRWKVVLKKFVLSSLANRAAFALTYNNL